MWLLAIADAVRPTDKERQVPALTRCRWRRSALGSPKRRSPLRRAMSLGACRE
jgi:hypothetical protein